MAVGKFIKAHGYRTSPVYKCLVCGKSTRETGEGESQFELCRKCYTEGGQENAHSDSHTGKMKNCKECEESLGYKIEDDRWCDHKE